MDNARLRNLIAGAENPVDGGDNLAIIIASHYESHPDCPDEDVDDELGWKPWAMLKTDRLLDAVVEIVQEKINAQEQERSEVRGSDESLVEALKDAHRDLDFFSSFITDGVLHSHLIPAQKRIEDVLNAKDQQRSDGGAESVESAG